MIHDVEFKYNGERGRIVLLHCLTGWEMKIMLVELTPEAKEFLEKKKGVSAVTIKMVMCGG